MLYNSHILLWLSYIQKLCNMGVSFQKIAATQEKVANDRCDKWIFWKGAVSNRYRKSGNYEADITEQGNI